jgi:hypothetical protein
MQIAIISAIRKGIVPESDCSNWQGRQTERVDNGLADSRADARNRYSIFFISHSVFWVDTEYAEINLS